MYTPIDILRSCSLRGRTWFLQGCGKPKCRSSGIGDTGKGHYVLEIYILNFLTYELIGTNLHIILHLFHSTVQLINDIQHILMISLLHVMVNFFNLINKY